MRLNELVNSSSEHSEQPSTKLNEFDNTLHFVVTLFISARYHSFQDPKLWQRRPIEQENLVPQAVEVGFILPSLMAQMSPLMREESSRQLMQGGQCLQSVREWATYKLQSYGVRQ